MRSLYQKFSLFFKNNHELCLLFWISYCTFFTLYSPQTLLQSIRADTGVSQSLAGLLITVSLIPLAFAPLVYGIFLNRISVRLVLILGMLFIGISLFSFVFTDQYIIFLISRIIQGIITPAVILSLMFYIATHFSGATVQRTLALYTATTMIGSFSGRIISGYIASISTWRVSFIIMILLAFSATISACLLQKEANNDTKHISPKEIIEVFKQKDVMKVIFCAPLCIFVHSSILNFIPFYMHTINPNVSEFGIGIIYIGALICALLGIFSQNIIRRIGGEIRAVTIGLSLFILFIPLILLQNYFMLFVALLGSSAGFTLVYTTMPGIVNRSSTMEKSVINGVYISMYYFFASMGTYFPVLLYSKFGVYYYVFFLLICISIATIIAIKARDVQGHLQS